MNAISKDAFIITVDIDWAPDFVMDELLETLISAAVKSTWFITHRSPLLEKLREQKSLVELGIHPNFLPQSTQGKSTDEVIKTSKIWCPMRGSCVRTR